jgi:uncharacterized oligopeptide transporter (OPT) family protein
MPLFQPAPRTAEEMENARPPELLPDQVAELDEDAWRARVYKGDEAPQLTLRAALMGAGLGFFLAFTNVYVGLKIGWHLGVALSACILSFSLWGFVRKLDEIVARLLARLREVLGIKAKTHVARTPMTILENNCMQSTASAAGYATGGTLISAIPAMLLLSVAPEHPLGVQLPWPVLAAWVFLLAVLGTSIAIPMKRNLINHERLKFPSGTAAAVLLRSLYSQGADALLKARALFYAALAGGIVPLIKDLDVFHQTDASGKVTKAALAPGMLKLFDWLPRVSGAGKAYLLSDWNVKLDYGPALIAAGALVGLRVTISMVVGGLVQVLVIGPIALGATWTNAAGIVVSAAAKPSSAWKDIGVWVGAPLLVSSGILSFAFQWRTIARAFRGLGGGAPDAASKVEVPTSWFVVGAGLSGAGIVVLSERYFDIPLVYGVLAVLVSFVLALVACRATGESDITPTGPMGKIMQLTYGVLMQQNATANLMTAGITAGASSASADLLTDLKSGYLLGANPRRQFVAQILGILPGTVATVLCYFILVPSVTALTGDAMGDPAFPAPAAQQWAAVAKVFKLGFANLHPMAREGIFWGLGIGVVMVLMERALPKHRGYLLSATGLGLGLILPFYQGLSMFLGAAIAAIASRKKDSTAAEMVVPVASGLIAGESIVGVVVAALNNFVLK